MRGIKSRTRNAGDSGIPGRVSKILKALLCSYVITGLLLLLLAGFLYKLNWDEGKVTVGIIIVYVFSTFVGGLLAGKMLKERKFLWGLTVGILYFALLLIVSFGLYRSLQGSGSNILTTFLLCAGGGMLGGMLS